MNETELESKIYDLKSKKIHLSTKLSMAMAKYWNKIETSQTEMDATRDEISEINIELGPLEEAYEKLFHHYYVRYSSLIPDPLNHQRNLYTFHGFYRSKVDCVIRWNNQQDTDPYLIKNSFELFSDIARQIIGIHSDPQFIEIIKWD